MEGLIMTPEIEALKSRLQATWTAGDFGEIAWSFEQGAADFAERLEIKPGTRVLDVACGNGNTAFPAARAGADVTGVDIAPYVIEQATKRAADMGINATFEVGDVEALSFEDASFDVVVSMFGAMFAPRPELTAAELKRVCRPGGTIAMANWTPDGFVGQMFKLTGKHVPPPVGMPSPVLWGDEDTVRQRFAEGVKELRLIRRLIKFVFPFGPAEVVEHFRKYYGPTQKAFAALDAEGQAALRKDLEDLWSNENTAQDGTTDVVSEYMEVRAVKA
jgi:SAM-dependent methyltransferase